jgi:hypothetical protein
MKNQEFLALGASISLGKDNNENIINNNWQFIVKKIKKK